MLLHISHTTRIHYIVTYTYSHIDIQSITHTHIYTWHTIYPHPPCYSLHQELSHVLIENKYLYHHTYASSMLYSVEECILSLSYTFSLIKNFKKFSFSQLEYLPASQVILYLLILVKSSSIWASGWVVALLESKGHLRADLGRCPPSQGLPSGSAKCWSLLFLFNGFFPFTDTELPSRRKGAS